ncbi:MAG: substrate-binding domain-containing protein [Oscillospiraceae bacterium]|nr:substrate-binding domain-containing protein [Oscillospiraceae bacterium]
MPKKRIAVITARADDSEQKTILSGIAETAFSMNADVVVFSNIYNHWVNDALLNFENHIYDFFQPEQFDGVIITAEAFMEISILDDVFEKIRKAETPAVIIGKEVEGFLTINSDDEADMKKIAEHLITVHGLTQIDILTGFEDMSVSQARVSGCRKAFENHGIPFDESHVHYGNFWNDSGEKLAQRYLDGELTMPQAVICTNDYMAYGLCDTLTAAGVQIPQQITITGYDNTEERIYHNPILTTYKRNRRETGKKAAGILLSDDYSLNTEDERFICGNTCSCGVDSIQLNEEIRTARIGQYHNVMSSVAQFTSRLTLCRTLAEYTAVLQEFFYLLHGVSELYLCLDKKWNSIAYDGNEFMCCAVNETTHSEIPVYFERSKLLPTLHEEHEKPMIFYFSPLCFQTRLFGYTVLAYEYPQCYDFSFRDWNKTVANTLEFLRMKNDIHYLRQCQRVSSLYDSLTGFYNLNEFRQIADTADAELSNDCFLQAVKLSFPANGEHLYGENYRSDIIVAIAKAIKQACSKHEICCRAAEDLFLVLCRNENRKLFSDKLKVMIHHALCGKYDENQVVVTCTEYKEKSDSKAVDAVCLKIHKLSDEAVKSLEQRKSLPHYKALLSLRTRNYEEPKKALSTDEVCRALCMSDGYFRVIYKKCFGVSYVQDCINARVMLACYLLYTSAMSIYAIALKCGYTDEKYFARQFRQSIGCSPMQYRERG